MGRILALGYAVLCPPQATDLKNLANLLQKTLIQISVKEGVDGCIVTSFKDPFWYISDIVERARVSQSKNRKLFDWSTKDPTMTYHIELNLWHGSNRTLSQCIPEDIFSRSNLFISAKIREFILYLQKKYVS